MVRWRQAEAGGERRGEARRQGEAPETESGDRRRAARLGSKTRRRRWRRVESRGVGGGNIRSKTGSERVRSKLPALV